MTIKGKIFLPKYQNTHEYVCCYICKKQCKKSEMNRLKRVGNYRLCNECRVNYKGGFEFV